jgi:hypothetical protein
LVAILVDHPASLVAVARVGERQPPLRAWANGSHRCARGRTAAPVTLSQCFTAEDAEGAEWYLVAIRVDHPASLVAGARVGERQPPLRA